MKIATTVTCVLLLLLTACAGDADQRAEGLRQVILATQRDHRLHVFDAATLEPLGRIAINNVAERVSVRPDGRMVFIIQGSTLNAHGCCALFALDLETGTMCRLMEPVTGQIPSPDGRWLFGQRGDVGIEVFDAQTLARMPTIEAPGVYRLHPSPDGRWIFGITKWRGPSLDVFDVERKSLIRRLPIPGGDGAWLGERFYLYARDSTQAYLWTVTPEMTELGPPITLARPNLAGDKLPIWQELVPAGEHLVLYQPLSWWFKLDARREFGKAIPGGVFVIDPASGKVTAHLTPSVDFAQVIASPDGRRLYGLDAGRPRWWGPPVRLLALDAASGAVLAERVLATNTWFITLATLPEALVPRGDVQPAPCPRAEPTPYPESSPPPVVPRSSPSR